MMYYAPWMFMSLLVSLVGIVIPLAVLYFIVKVATKKAIKETREEGII